MKRSTKRKLGFAILGGLGALVLIGFAGLLGGFVGLYDAAYVGVAAIAAIGFILVGTFVFIVCRAVFLLFAAATRKIADGSASSRSTTRTSRAEARDE